MLLSKNKDAVHEQHQVRIGITGGIGSGKSYVCSRLRLWGYPVYDCDARAKHIMTSDAEVMSSLIDLLGENVYLRDGETITLNKPVLANYLFASEANALRINEIVHPVVKSDFLRWAVKQNSKYVFMESAILFESHFDDAVHLVLLISAPLTVRIERAMKRDSTSREKVEARIRAQWSDERLKERSDYVLLNDGQADVDGQLCKLLEQWDAEI